MTAKSAPKTLLLSLAVTVALAACNRDAAAPAAPDAPAAETATAATLTLDESTLPGVNRFQASDLDPAAPACTDFAAHANGKWLAGNEIPGELTALCSAVFVWALGLPYPLIAGF